MDHVNLDPTVLPNRTLEPITCDIATIRVLAGDAGSSSQQLFLKERSSC